MTGFDNKDLKGTLYNGPVVTTFAPKVDYSFNSGTSVITLTDTSTYAAGDDRKIAQVEVIDHKGDKKVSNIAGADVDDAITIDCTTLDKSKGLTVLVTIVTNKGLTTDGHAKLLAISSSAGSLGGWNIQDTTVA